MRFGHNCIRYTQHCVALILAMPLAFSVQAANCSRAWEALIQLAADRVDGVFGDVAASTRALAEEYLKLIAKQDSVSVSPLP